MKRDEATHTPHALIRKIGFYSMVFMAAGVAVAVLGAALVALLLRVVGLPFLPTWAVLSGLVILVALLGVMVQSRRKP
jgi:hypothetical protein